MRLDFSTGKQALEWKKMFEKKSLTTLRMSRTYAKESVKNEFKKDFRCHHVSRAVPSVKGKRCPCFLTVIVKRWTKMSKYRSTDPHMPELPTIVHLVFSHDHPIKTADALRRHEVATPVKRKFEGLFQKMYRPVEALDIHKQDLQMEHGERYLYVASDPAQVPDIQWCHRYFDRLFGDTVDNNTTTNAQNDVVEDLQRFVSVQNSLNGDGHRTISMRTFPDGRIILAIITPLMRRVLCEIPQSAKVVFVDSSSPGGRKNLRSCLLLTGSCVGGLPVGCIVFAGSDVGRDDAEAALGMWRDALPRGSFAGRGPSLGPECFFVDDFEPRRAAVANAFPNSETYLCAFHLLQDAWRWIWDGGNGVGPENRLRLFALAQSLLATPSVERLAATLASLRTDPAVAVHSGFVAYATKLYERRKEWLVGEADAVVGDNYLEVATRVLNEKVLSRSRASNVLQLCDFVVSRMEAYFENRVLDVVNDRFDWIKYTKFRPDDASAVGCIEKLADGLYAVGGAGAEAASGGVPFYVNPELGMCSCESGSAGAPCEHQGAVSLAYNIRTMTVAPVEDVRSKSTLHYVATGQDYVTAGRSRRSCLFFGAEGVRAEPYVERRRVVGRPPDGAKTTTLLRPKEEPMDVKVSPIVPSDVGELRRLDGAAASYDFTDDATCSSASQVRDVATLRQRFDVWAEKLSRRLEDRSAGYAPAVEAFLDRLNNTKTDSDVVSALDSFGTALSTTDLL